MKTKVIVLLGVVILSLFACKPKSEVISNQPPLTSSEINENATKSWELEGEAYDAWKAIKEDFVVSVFNPLLDKHKIKLNCNDCTKVIFKVKIKISDDGKFISYEKINLYVCGDEIPVGFEAEMINYFAEITFDDSLNGMVIEAYLGRALKC